MAKESEKRDLRRLCVLPALVASLLIAALSSTASAREKTDEVILTNGDHLKGEIKGMNYGLMTLSTDPMDTVQIKWENIEAVTSRYSFQVELRDGTRFFGALGAGSESRTILVTGQQKTVRLLHDEIVRITPIEGTWLQRIDGSFSLGFSFTKASDVAQFSFSGDATYRTRRNEVSASVSSIMTRQTEETTKRNEFYLRYMRLLEQKWFLAGLSSVQNNDELGIDLRISLGAGGGRFLVQTNRMSLPVLAGLMCDREWGSAGGEGSYNLEAVVGATWSVFIYHEPKTSLKASVYTYPYLTEAGRVRVDFESHLRRELVKDFFVDLSLYTNYDNRPPSTTASASDYGVVTSLGYSF
jgi:hypothetical protein